MLAKISSSPQKFELSLFIQTPLLWNTKDEFLNVILVTFFQYNYSERGLGLSSLKNEAKSIVKVVQMSCGTNKTKFYIIIY